MKISEPIAQLLGKQKDDPFVSVDIGTSAIKLMVLELGGEQPKLLAAGSLPTPANAISNNAVTRPDQIAQTIRAVIDANDIDATKATISIPGPSAFTKKITIGYSDLKDLASNIGFEASNYIPHSIDAVRLDYQVLKTTGTSTMDVLLVAVKNEIIDSYVHAIQMAGLEPAIADVDYFALENMFQMNYPEQSDKCVALINIGARYTSVNLLQGEESLFTGDVGIGGRLYTDALCETLGMQPAQAEEAKAGNTPAGFDDNLINETFDRTTEHLASELHRQLGFFWSAAATDRSIESVFVTGGGAQVSGLVEELSVKTGMNCQMIESFRNIDWAGQFDQDYIEEIAPAMGISVGLATRRFGDKKHAID